MYELYIFNLRFYVIQIKLKFFQVNILALDELRWERQMAHRNRLIFMLVFKGNIVISNLFFSRVGKIFVVTNPA